MNNEIKLDKKAIDYLKKILGGGGGTEVSANIDYGYEYRNNQVEGLASLKVGDKVYEVSQPTFEWYPEDCLYAEGISEVITKYYGEDYEVGQNEVISMAFTGYSAGVNLRVDIGANAVEIVVQDRTQDYIVIPGTSRVEVDTNILTEILSNSDVVSLLEGTYATSAVEINNVHLITNVSGSIEKYYTLSNNYAAELLFQPLPEQIDFGQM